MQFFLYTLVFKHLSFILLNVYIYLPFSFYLLFNKKKKKEQTGHIHAPSDLVLQLQQMQIVKLNCAIKALFS